MSDRENMVIRAMGSGKMHVAALSTSDLFEHVVFGSHGTFVALPQVQVACGVRLNGNNGVVVMTKSDVSCVQCRRLTGVAGVRDGELVHA